MCADLKQRPLLILLYSLGSCCSSSSSTNTLIFGARSRTLAGQAGQLCRFFGCRQPNSPAVKVRGGYSKAQHRRVIHYISYLRVPSQSHRQRQQEDELHVVRGHARKEGRVEEKRRSALRSNSRNYISALTMYMARTKELPGRPEQWNRKLFTFLFVQLSFNFHPLAIYSQDRSRQVKHPFVLLTCEQQHHRRRRPLSGTSTDERNGQGVTSYSYWSWIGREGREKYWNVCKVMAVMDKGATAS